MSYITPRLKPPRSSEFKLQDPKFWLHDLPSILSGSRPRITTQSNFDVPINQPDRPTFPIETLPPDSLSEGSNVRPCALETNRQHLPAERNPSVNPANNSSNKRPRIARGDADDVQKSNEALLAEGNFRVIECADGDIDGIFANFAGCSHIAVSAIDNSFSSPFKIFGRATAEFDRLFGFVLSIEAEHLDAAQFVALIMPPNKCLEFIYKLLGCPSPVCMWNVMETLRQCEKQTYYKNNVDWSLRHCVCLSAAVWLIDPSADCTDFESCVAFIKNSTQIQPPIIPSETIAIPSDKLSRCSPTTIRLRMYIDVRICVCARMRARACMCELTLLCRIRFLRSCLCCCVELSKHVMLELEQLGMVHLFRSIEMPSIGITLAMERFGIGFVPSTLEDHKRALKARSQELVAEANAVAGTSFLLSSPQQLAEVLFETLKLPVVNQRNEDRIDSRRKLRSSCDLCDSSFYMFASDKKHEIKHGKYTVSEEVLLSLIDKHPLPRIALEYRQVAIPPPSFDCISHPILGFKDVEYFH